MAKVDFIFSRSDSSINSFEIIKDGVCEPDEIFAAQTLPEEIEGFEVKAVDPTTTFIIIRDLDGECPRIILLTTHSFVLLM